MSQLIPFESAKLPAHLSGGKTKNEDLFAGGGAGFPVLSIKGKIFTLKRSGENKVITRPDDPDSAASGIDLVILRAQKGMSKTYYMKGFTEGADAAPDCFSNDGVAPDPTAEHKQSAQCATCKHNQWGSKVSDAGKELKACQDNKRFAVAAPGQLNDPMLLRVPPGSFKALNEYAKLLSKRDVGYNAVVTRVSFVMESATPQLAFKPVGFLEAASFAEAEEQVQSDIVQQIIGALPTESSAEEFDTPEPAAATTAAGSDASTEDDDEAAAAEAEAAAAAAKAKAAKAKAAKAKAAKEAADPIPESVAKEAAEAVAVAKAESTAKAAKAKDEPVALDIDLDESLASALAEFGNMTFDD